MSSNLLNLTIDGSFVDTMANATIVLSNLEVVAFFKARPHISPDIFTLGFIKLFESSLDTNTTDDINTTLNLVTSTVASNMQNIIAKLDSADNEIKALKRDMTSNNATHTVNIHSLMQTYTSDLKNTIQLDKLTNQDVLKTNMATINQSLTNDISAMVQSAIPQNTAHFNSNITASITEAISGHISGLDNSIRSQVAASDRNIDTVYAKIDANAQSMTRSIENIMRESTEHKLSTNDLAAEMRAFLQKYAQNSSTKGGVSETELVRILTQILPSDEIVHVAAVKGSGDVHVNRRDAMKPALLFESKDYSSSVPTEEVAKFERDVASQKRHGIMISQSGPIALKLPFQIDVKNDLIHLYIPCANYSAERIQTAIDIVDNLSIQLASLNRAREMDAGTTISKIDMDAIVQEYTMFGAKKDKLLEMLRQSTKCMTSAISELELPSIKNMCVAAGAMQSGSELVCKYCEWTGKTRGSVTTHMRACKQNPAKTQMPSESLVSERIKLAL